MTTLEILAWTSAIAPLLPLGLGVYNRLTWARPQSWPAFDAHKGQVSVLVPARNEGRNIRACVSSALAQGDCIREVLVYSDESTDDTESIVRELEATDPRVRLIVGSPLPPGWIGKPHACQVLGVQARAPWLLFLDADVRLATGGGLGLLREAVERGSPVQGDRRLIVLSAVPKQHGGTWALDLLQPLLHLTYTSWLPLSWANRRRSPRFLAACGQLLLVSRAAFDRVGGFRAVRGAVVDDLEFCRHGRRAGSSVTFVDGHDLAVCRMYQDTRSFWGGFAKNLFLGLGSEQNLLLALALHVACFLLPYGLGLWWLGSTLVGERPPSSVLLLASLGVLANLMHRTILAARHGQRWWSVALHPVAVVLLVLLALDSWRRGRLTGVQWAGRSYRGSLA